MNQKPNADMAARAKLQEQFRTLVEQRQKLDSQLNEINMAKQEVDLLEPDAKIFKLVGPLMTRQDLPEVKETMKARLNYLNDGIARLDKEIEEVRKKSAADIAAATAAAAAAASSSTAQTSGASS